MVTNNRKLKIISDKIYRYFNRNWNKLYHDDGWENVDKALDGICQTIEEVEDIQVSGGKYFNYNFNTNETPYRDYKIIIKTQYGNIEGYLRCCAAGTVEDPFDRYDMLISLWTSKNEDDIVEECVNKTLNKILETVVKTKTIKLSESEINTLKTILNLKTTKDYVFGQQIEDLNSILFKLNS